GASVEGNSDASALGATSRSPFTPRMAYLPGWLLMWIKTYSTGAGGVSSILCSGTAWPTIKTQACRMQPSRHASSDCCPIHLVAGKLRPQVVQVAPGVC